LSILTGCGEPMRVNGKNYPSYGLFNESTSKSKNMCYEISAGNVIWSIVTFETVFIPVYFVGWSIFNPVGLKDVNGNCGIDKGN
jgi:hypothetical protein